jgi:hypothetical protein
MAENQESESAISASRGDPDIHERLERLREKTSRLAETVRHVEETLKEAKGDSES